MKVAHIVPPEVVVHVGFAMHDYHLLLPALAKNFMYREFYRNRMGLKIMDNGVAEGARANFEQLLVAAKVLRCHEVVLPDVLYSMDATLHAIGQIYHTAFDARSDFRFMVVAQGGTVVECVATVQRALNMYPGIIYSVGIPRHILSLGVESRVQIASEIRRFYTEKPIHLLGTHPEFPGELALQAKKYQALDVRGVDTSLAWNATLNRIQLSDPESLSYNIEISRQSIGDFLKARPSAISFPLLENNMRKINEWVED